MPGRAGHGTGLLVDGEVTDGETAGHGRAQRPGLDHRVMAGVAVGGAGLPAAVAESPLTSSRVCAGSAPCGLPASGAALPGGASGSWPGPVPPGVPANRSRPAIITPFSASVLPGPVAIVIS